MENDKYLMSDRSLLENLMYVNKWTQDQLAEHLEIDQSMISRVVNGKRNLSRSTRKLAKILLTQKPQTEQEG